MKNILFAALALMLVLPSSAWALGSTFNCTNNGHFVTCQGGNTPVTGAASATSVVTNAGGQYKSVATTDSTTSVTGSALNSSRSVVSNTGSTYSVAGGSVSGKSSSVAGGSIGRSGGGSSSSVTGASIGSSGGGGFSSVARR